MVGHQANSSGMLIAAGGQVAPDVCLLPSGLSFARPSAEWGPQGGLLESNNTQDHMPRIIGLEYCPSAKDKLWAVAGLFNSGTNLLHQLLSSNCDFGRRQQCNNIAFAVPWGKHNPLHFRSRHRRSASGRPGSGGCQLPQEDEVSDWATIDPAHVHGRVHWSCTITPLPPRPVFFTHDAWFAGDPGRGDQGPSHLAQIHLPEAVRHPL